LLVVRHWDQASIGFVMAISGIGAIVAQTPVGARNSTGEARNSQKLERVPMGLRVAARVGLNPAEVA